MSDIWSVAMFVARFDGLPVEVLSTRDSFRRVLATSEYPNRDGAISDDMGAAARVLDVRILFREGALPADAPADFAAMDHIDRSRTFIDACNQGITREFVHPLYGSFPAKIESLDVSADGEQRDRIDVQARVVEQGLDPAPLLSQTGRQLEGGTPSVDIEADTAALTAAEVLDEEEAEDVAGVAAAAAAEAARWEDPDFDPHAVTVGLGTASDEIDRVISEADLLADPARYPTYRALMRLRYQLGRAAEVATRNAPALIDLVTAAASPLGAILADLYGADGAVTRRAEVIRLNSIRDPMLIDGGTRLVVPSPRPIRTQRTRRQGPAYAR